MSAVMSDADWRAFVSEGTRTGKLATSRRDGSPHVAPFWFAHGWLGNDLVFRYARHFRTQDRPPANQVGSWHRSGGASRLHAVEGVEHVRKRLPLWPVWRFGLPLVGLTLGEAGLALVPVDVVVSGDHGDPVGLQAERAGDRGDGLAHLAELRGSRLLGEVAGEHHQIGPDPFAVGQPAQVVDQPRGKRVVCAVTAVSPREPKRCSDPNCVSDRCSIATDWRLIENGALLPGPHAMLAGPTYREWLERDLV